MYKVSSFVSMKNPGPSTQRKCQVCGNAYLAMSVSSRSCEFCKTPFAGTLGSARARNVGAAITVFAP